MAETDHSFFDNFSDHLQSTVGQQAQGLSQLKIENAKMNSNKNLSGETKTVANVLDAVDAGVQAFGLVTGAVLSYGFDFYLNGVIPLEIERLWFSDSNFSGHLGYGVHSIFDVQLKVDEEST